MMFVNLWIDNKTVAHLHNGILLEYFKILKTKNLDILMEHEAIILSKVILNYKDNDWMFCLFALFVQESEEKTEKRQQWY